MIKIKDLMLDDLVLTKDGHTGKVVSLYKNHKGSSGDIMVDSDSKIFMSLVREDDLEPIFLTEEILLKNGFEKIDKTENKALYWFYYLVIEYDYDLKEFWFNGNEGSSILINYVNQLQHLLRMFNMEDKADNLKL